MHNESFAATTARELAVLEELFLHAIYVLAPEVRDPLLRIWNISTQEIKNGILARLDAGTFDRYQQAGRNVAGNSLSVLGHRVRV